MMDPSLPLISVIIPTRNRVQRLERGLERLIADDYPNKEIIVCDGASTDGTVDLLRSYGDVVRWISEDDGGEFQARNRALRMATGEIIRYLSDDDEHVPGIMFYAVQYFNNYSDVDILFGQVITYYEDVTGNVVISDNAHRGTDSIALSNFIRHHRPLPKSETVFFRRKVIDQIGFFDTIRGADYDYWAHAYSAGLKLAIADDVFVHGFRYESGEQGLVDAYRGTVFTSLALAQRYGTWFDKLYVWVLLPFQLLKYEFIQVMPPNLVRSLRQQLWRWRQNKVPSVSS
ncbi:MAG: glycosyltransferase [Caldilineaceae bacterium]|nr:glycosyltransferase [Caldilineaceae bacterium]